MPAPRVRLAGLASPPDTSQLERAGARETADAIRVLTGRLWARRAVLAAREMTGPRLDVVLAGLQRLRNPELRGYRTCSGIVLSEPFGARSCSLRAATQAQARRLVARLLGREPSRSLVAALSPFGVGALSLAVDRGIRIAVVPAGRAFSQCSRSVAALVPDIDRWQAPPAGLFVLEERLVLLRQRALRMAAAHEFAHAIDAVLAQRPRSYFSFESARVRQAFASASGFVNEYAAGGLDEFFAESMRAYVEVNDDHSAWLPVTRMDLWKRGPQIYSIIDELFRRELAG